MKGFTLAVDTVVIIVVAGVVLLVILAFFKGSGSQGASQANLQQERTTICREYVQMDLNCDGTADDSSAAGKLKETRKKVVDICAKLGGYASCDDEKKGVVSGCVHDCCGFLCMGE
ncbi:MAG: hypothetical protein HZB66_00660 [Candidatus Aenigmarchaeota archaeon]|nr:hypothetical protein [Candidatus Aenigmarchaeota archaeon]